MSTSENKQLVRRCITEAVNEGKPELLENFLSRDFVNHTDKTRGGAAIEEAREHLLAVRRTYPDLKLTVQDQIAEGDIVVTRLKMRGTHKGEWLGMKPTGKIVEIDGVNIDRVVDGRIVEHWGVANTLEALLEIEALKMPLS
jgi:predicted ester cyclase